MVLKHTWEGNLTPGKVNRFQAFLTRGSSDGRGCGRGVVGGVAAARPARLDHEVNGHAVEDGVLGQSLAVL